MPPWWAEFSAKYAASLRTITLRSNAFTAVPNFSMCGKLVELCLNGNELMELSSAGLPPSLTRLDVVNNELVRIEAELLSSLTKLVRLDVTGNLLTTAALEGMAGAFGRCKTLEVLDLSCNRLDAVPTGVLDATSLLELRLNMNPLGR